MHIEPGFLLPGKLLGANIAAVGMLGYYAKDLVKNPFDIIKACLAALFFSIFMQSFHMKVGPSELHFVGAMAIYLTLGFRPTLYGFGLGLLLQGIVFDPMDLPHLAVNSLSLMVPLVTVHMTIGKKLFSRNFATRVSWKEIAKLDAVYYAGVVTMVGFWLFMSNVATPFSAWASFAASYLAVVAVEPFVTLATVRLLKKYETTAVVRKITEVGKLRLAS
jgi:hypothetical protein